MRVILVGAVLVTLAACGGPTGSFTWIDGNKYRWLNEPSVCTNDGSAVFFQRADDEGEFADPERDITEAKCARAAG